ncbi:MAG: hypothetical protein JW768_13600 [Chitinispirillaceae bacterium]|nr:hypothetical protein [Chitinispirillaceae bacterium]
MKPVLLAAVITGSALLLPSLAQEITESTITTDSVDLFSGTRLGQKSAKAAMAASLLVPGSGHHYLQRNRSALAFITADAASFFAVFICRHYAGRLAQDAAGYAWIHAGAHNKISDADDYYWKLVGNFMDVDEYNTVMDLNRTPEDKITDPNLRWYWDDESSQEYFNSLRTKSRGYRIASSFFLGALILDRIIAFIDIRTYSRKSSIKRGTLSALDIIPRFEATPLSIQCSFNGSF